MQTHVDITDRFAKFCLPIPESGCIVWLGACTKGHTGKWHRKEYGKFKLPGGKHGKNVSAHRFAYEAMFGPIPSGMELDHLCRVTLCVNPTHLEVVSRYENNRRSMSPSALNMQKVQCQRGHLLAGENLYVNGNRRTCKLCRAVSKRRFHAKNREKCLLEMREYHKKGYSHDHIVQGQILRQILLHD